MTEVHTQDLLEQLNRFNVPDKLAKAMVEVAGWFHLIQKTKDLELSQDILQEHYLGLAVAYHELSVVIHAEIQTHSYSSICPHCGKGVRVRCTSFTIHPCHDMEKRGHCPGRPSKSESR